MSSILRAIVRPFCVPFREEYRGKLPQRSLPIVVDLRNGVWPSIAHGDIEERDECTAQAGDTLLVMNSIQAQI
jgi:hypothetical protein